ncbi:GL24916 [Drosophila persimilis]|uniref:CCAAT/enhancer-binding protein gamma n=2 Tax=pseudoobscura subgroup TaxID=32358 RepID=Q2M0I7_DROPS|nr:CCAAT/enhancer-binding protein gamma [Drosophila pseudoobscura]XP_002021235.1 CCAAT/enhancer-binding protein gamma [Drosophila persimilis]XP_017138406.1 CCAAT/enhancer-binding protein gamma [Drosophila miranda]EDW40391.1 GL24916 [Drosophila persimilis]
MPARRRTATAEASSSKDAESPMSPQSDDPAYKLKRKKNNEAVQRTREKTKKSAEDRKKRIEKLKQENEQLKVKIKSGKKHIATLRELIIQGEKTEDHHRIIQEILGAPDSDNDDEDDDDDPSS